MQIRCETPGGRKKYIYAPARHDVHCIGLDMVALGCGFRAVGCRLLANLGSLSWRNPCSRFLPLTPAQDAQTSKPIGRRKTAGWVSGFHPAAAGSWPPSSESGNPVRSCGSGGRAASTVRRSAAVQVLVSKSKRKQNQDWLEVGEVLSWCCTGVKCLHSSRKQSRNPNQIVAQPFIPSCSLAGTTTPRSPTICHDSNTLIIGAPFDESV